MAAFTDRDELLRHIVESVLTTSPLTLDTLSDDQRVHLEQEAHRKRLTPLALLMLARAEVLSQIEAERDVKAIALEIYEGS
ncbi:hypothetical protein [Cryobacterium soli]|uniref:hypothetical protein n=1 Tax=Cryobacterium soli TaxID=2220095 RepID=UPI000E71A40B|nr:hypothetical protein [Cryobacterium soli]